MVSFKDRVDTLLGIAIPTLGEQITFEFTQLGGVLTIKAVFDEAYEAVDTETNAIISSNQPRFGVRLRDFSPKKPGNGDLITVSGGRKYTVTDVQEDGQGGAYLFAKLKKGVVVA